MKLVCRASLASFLVLSLAPRSALRNLRRLRDMGLEGRYGLYEAVDYDSETPHGRLALYPRRFWA